MNPDSVPAALKLTTPVKAYYRAKLYSAPVATFSFIGPSLVLLVIAAVLSPIAGGVYLLLLR